jgi:hypothetical protein
MIRAIKSNILPSMDLSWKSVFADHPRSVGESYAEHFAAASRFGLRLLAAGLACLLHAVVPCWCTRSASRAIAALSREMESRGAPRDYAVAAATADSSSEAASLHSRSRS